MAPAEGDLFLLASNGKARRLSPQEFPLQRRYGKGVRAWELPRAVKLVGLALGKPNTVVTLHLFKASPQLTRLDAVPLRKRSAVRGESVAEVNPGDAVTSLTEAWMLERFVAVGKKEKGKEKKAASTNKKAPARKPAGKQ